MASAATEPQLAPASTRADTAILLAIASAIALLHILTNNRYGFHRDELQFLSDARHLEWGFVPYPPFTPFIERIGLRLFGISMVGLRLFSVVAQSTAIVVTGLMTREFGGSRLAQIIAASAVALSPLPLFQGTEFQYSSFDYLWWVLAAYFAIRLLKTEDPRWWIAIGASFGLGLMTKYTICLAIAGLILGLIATPYRRLLLTYGFLAGVATALLIFLPNFLWQAHHGFITYHFLQHIHVRDVAQGRAEKFLTRQFTVNNNFYAAPLWIGGLICLLRSPRFRALAFLYIVPFVALYFGKGLFYYLAPPYPLLIAMGSAAGVCWAASLRRPWGVVLEAVMLLGIAGGGAYACALVIPLANSGPIKQFALKNNDTLREEFGWDELIQTLAAIRDSMPPDRQQSLGIVVGNYGEQGAIELLGPPYHLPPPISMTNSAWLRGYPTPQPTTLIVLGFSRKGADQTFAECRLAGRETNREGLHNEEYGSEIFVCGPPRQPWPEFWKTHQHFG